MRVIQFHAAFFFVGALIVNCKRSLHARPLLEKRVTHFPRIKIISEIFVPHIAPIPGRRASITKIFIFCRSRNISKVIKIYFDKYNLRPYVKYILKQY